MSELTWGIRPDEAARPSDRVERHIASGSGWEEPGGRGGGRVPAVNPWKASRPTENPAQDGVGLLSWRGRDRRDPHRRR
jgi:hypothetical protein